MDMPIEGHVFILNEGDAKRLHRSLAAASEMIWEILSERKLKLTMGGEDFETELTPPRNYDPPPLEDLF